MKHIRKFENIYSCHPKIMGVWGLFLFYKKCFDKYKFLNDCYDKMVYFGPIKV